MCRVDWLLLLEYFRVLASWPPVVMAVGLSALILFRKQLGSLVGRINEGKFPGGSFSATPLNQTEIKMSSDKLEKIGTAVDAAASKTPQVTNAASSAEPMPEILIDDPNLEAALKFMKETPFAAAATFKHMALEKEFERIFNYIYGTQISLLRSLRDAAPHANPLTSLAQYHQRHQELSKSTGYPLDEYVEFLTRTELISLASSVDGRTYKVTDKGISFLKYIQQNYPERWESRSF